MRNFDDYMDTKSAIASLLDDGILSGSLKAYQVQQMVDEFVLRYTGWTDGRVPRDVCEAVLTKRQVQLDEVEGPISPPVWEILRITEVQFIRWIVKGSR